MAAIEERVGALEMRVDGLETWAGPGQADAFAVSLRMVRADLSKVRQTQDRHSRMLDVLTSDVAGLKTDVAGLKTDVAGLKTDVADLKTDVAGLRSDMTEMKGTLREILARLPAA